MSILYRLGNASDIAACVHLLRAERCFEPDESVWPLIGPAWERALVTGQMPFVVFEDMSAESDRRLVSFVTTLMISDGFVEILRRGAGPHAIARLYTATGFDENHVLSLRQIAQANAAQKLNLLVMHNPLRDRGLADDRFASYMPVFLAGFQFEHGGYNLNSIVWQVYGELFAGALSTAGYSLFDPFLEAPGIDQVDPVRRPMLMARFRDQITERTYSFSGLLVATTRVPRMGLSNQQQRLLRLALMEHSDAELESLLGVSRNAIKQTWRAIFDKARRSLAHLFDGLGPFDENRTGSLRRLVINYVRQHPEELRPFKASG